MVKEYGELRLLDDYDRARGLTALGRMAAGVKAVAVVARHRARTIFMAQRASTWTIKNALTRKSEKTDRH